MHTHTHMCRDRRRSVPLTPSYSQTTTDHPQRQRGGQRGDKRLRGAGPQALLRGPNPVGGEPPQRAQPLLGRGAGWGEEGRRGQQWEWDGGGRVWGAAPLWTVLRWLRMGWDGMGLGEPGASSLSGHGGRLFLLWTVSRSVGGNTGLERGNGIVRDMCAPPTHAMHIGIATDIYLYTAERDGGAQFGTRPLLARPPH